MRDENDVQDLGVHVSAKADVSVYGLNRIKFTTDAFVGLPTDALGTDYRVVSYARRRRARGLRGGDRRRHDRDHHADRRPDGAHRPASRSRSCSTWARPTSCARAGTSPARGSSRTSPWPRSARNNCANVPVGVPYCDHLVEQLTPVDTWGRRFVDDAAGHPHGRRHVPDPRRRGRHDGQGQRRDASRRSGPGEFHEQLIDGPATIEAEQAGARRAVLQRLDVRPARSPIRS